MVNSQIKIAIIINEVKFKPNDEANFSIMNHTQTIIYSLSINNEYGKDVRDILTY